MSARPIASGTVSFGLVSIPVKLFSATEASEKISFNTDVTDVRPAPDADGEWDVTIELADGGTAFFDEIGDLPLESGEVIPDFEISYVTHGTRSPAGNAAPKPRSMWSWSRSAIPAGVWAVVRRRGRWRA